VCERTRDEREVATDFFSCFFFLFLFFFLFFFPTVSQRSAGLPRMRVVELLR
jgi:hypothetical protein